MNRHWIRRAGSARLLLVFAGWGLGPAPFLGLRGDDDVLVVDDYTRLDDSLSETLDYDRTALLGFSFGVVSAAHWIAETGFRTERRIAVNGTLFPADETRGIPPAMVEATLNGLTAASFAAFCRRAGHGGGGASIRIGQAQQDLRAIVARGAAPPTRFDRIWISERDRIVPPAAQKTAWQDQAAAIRMRAAPHQPFRAGQSWQEWLA